MKVRTHIKAGEFTTNGAVGATGSVLAGHHSDGRGASGFNAAVSNGAHPFWLAELREFWGVEIKPWVSLGDGRLQGMSAGPSVRSTSYSYGAAEPGIQSFARRWIDPLFGERGDRQLRELGLTVDEAAMHPRERVINRNLVVSLGTFGLVTAGVTVAPILLPVGAALIILTVVDPAAAAYDAWTKRRKLTAAFTATLSLVGAWVAGYYWAAALGSVLLSASEKVLFLSQNRARHSLVSVFGEQPRTAWVLADGSEVEVPLDQVQRGDSVVVQAGQTIPIDGTIVKGIASIDQHMLTGEAQPVERGVGDAVLATTIVLTGSIQVAVEKAGQDTAAAEIGRLFSQVDSYQLSVQAKALEFGDAAVAPSLALGALAWPVLSFPAAVAMMRLPLASSLRLTAPIAMLNYLNVLAHQGILVKDGRSLELLAEVDTIVFDKTGTLTLEQPHVAAVHVVRRDTEDDVVRWAAWAEQRQSHPIARAILTAARERGLALRGIDDAHYEVGFGIQAHVAGEAIRVGSRRYMDMEGLSLPAELQVVQAQCAAQGHSLVWVAVDDAVVGALELHATVRPEAKALVEKLKARGLEAHILSGDQEAPTQRLAQELGMDHYSANVLPGGKAEVIERLQAQGKSVCFVGDGINDAIALKTAHVSVSLRGATTVAMDAAQVC
ncbi:MAG: heavy metal translocating P-type ATPase [Anaerolineae bacterium]|nr:heavy metal translocating P-type ATPase [Anaerolineae bacterium]